MKFMFGLQHPLTCKPWTTLSKPCNKMRGEYLKRSLFVSSFLRPLFLRLLSLRRYVSSIYMYATYIYIYIYILCLWAKKKYIYACAWYGKYIYIMAYELKNVHMQVWMKNSDRHPRPTGGRICGECLSSYTVGVFYGPTWYREYIY